MNGGYPVRVAQITVFRRDRTGIAWTPLKPYWAVTTELVGDCGHKHKTEAAADKCRPAMVAKWRKARGWK